LLNEINICSSGFLERFGATNCSEHSKAAGVLAEEVTAHGNEPPSVGSFVCAGLIFCLHANRIAWILAGSIDSAAPTARRYQMNQARDLNRGEYDWGLSVALRK